LDEHLVFFLSLEVAAAAVVGGAGVALGARVVGAGVDQAVDLALAGAFAAVGKESRAAIVALPCAGHWGRDGRDGGDRGWRKRE
jgi:hypothetical protein